MSRSYRQNCALAYGLDIIGERWTLLIVRELLISSRRYNELLDNLVGIGTNLLAKRLWEMQERGLLRKTDGNYALTESGRLLEPVVWSIVRFGLSLEKNDDPEWLIRPEWDAVALRAVYDAGKGAALSGRYVLELNKVPFTIERHGDTVDISTGDTEDPVVRVGLSKAVARRLAGGKASLSAAADKGQVKIQGGRREAFRLLSAFGIV